MTRHNIFLLLIALLSGCGRALAKTAACDSLILSGVTAMQKADYSGALALLTEAQTAAKENHWANQQFLATNNIGLVYYLMYDYGEALTHYREAYNIALREGKTKQEMTVLNNIAILYSREKDFAKAASYFERAYVLAKKNQTPVNIGYYAINLGTLYNETGELEKARPYLQEAIENLSGVPDRLLSARITLADNDYLQGNISQAERSALALWRGAKDSGYVDLESQALMVLAKALVKEKKPAEALFYAAEAKRVSRDLEEKIMLNNLMADVYTESGSPQLALPLKDSVIILKDSLYRVRNGRVFENSKVKFELQNSRHELAEKREQLHRQRQMFLTVIGATLAVALGLFWWLRNRAFRAKQKKQIAELEREKEKHENLLLEKQLKEKETLAHLERERFQNELERKNRKLLAKAMYLSERNERIDGILTSLSQIPHLTGNDALAKQMNQLKHHLKEGEETENMSLHFEEVNGDLIRTLQEKHPAINANDLRFLSYVYMNLSNKEIGSLLNITPEGCRKRKERIMKKMSLPSDVPLYTYLQEL